MDFTSWKTWKWNLRHDHQNMDTHEKRQTLTLCN
jgi:hypothetical protein